MLDQAQRRAARNPVRLSICTIGMQCGGSDGLSGLSATPRLAWRRDIQCATRYGQVLSETPEILASNTCSPAAPAAKRWAANWFERMTGGWSIPRVRDTQINAWSAPANQAGGLQMC